MTRARVAAALAALLTALLLQATVIGPVTMSVPGSLPAVLVAAVALVDGPGAGLAFGFASGLIADLASQHPAGVLAVCWLGIGVLSGLCAAPQTTVRRDAAVAGVVCALGAVAATLLLTALGADGATLGAALRYALPALLVDWVLALGLVVVVRAFLRADPLRAPRPVLLLGEDVA